MGTLGTLYPVLPQKFNPTHLPSASTFSKFHTFAAKRTKLTTTRERPISPQFQLSPKTVAVLTGAAGITLISLAGTSNAAESPFLNEPSNALSIPTWAVHFSSVVEWATAMALVWQYGEKSGLESWKGLSWGMVLVAIQAALTVIGNVTMCFAAYRVYVSSQELS